MTVSAVQVKPSPHENAIGSHAQIGASKDHEHFFKKGQALQCSLQRCTCLDPPATIIALTHATETTKLSDLHTVSVAAAAGARYHYQLRSCLQAVYHKLVIS